MPRKRLVVDGVCGKGHLLSPNNVRMEGDRVRCRACTGAARVMPKLVVGGKCGNGHLLTEETTYRYPETSRTPGKIVCKQCRIKASRKNQGYSGSLDDPINRWSGEKDKTHCANNHEYTAETKYVDPRTGWVTCQVCKKVTAFAVRAAKYGMTAQQLQEKLDRAAGRCAICGEEFDLTGTRPFEVDHDHACCPGQFTCGGCVRGLLCGDCNRLLGAAHDDPVRLRGAADYLSSFTTR